MESGPATSVDPQALHAAAQRLDAAADLLHGAITAHLRTLRFDADSGLRSAVDQLVADVAQWQRATAETAAALRISAERYTDAEARASQALR